MKAVILTTFGGTENFELTAYPKPQCKENEILVAIKATAFNPIDYQMRRGDTESKLLKSPILGRELAGEVEEVGSKVTRFRKGDRISAYVGSLGSNGTYAEYISFPSELAAIIPSGVDYAQAAALPLVGMTALQVTDRITLDPSLPLFISGGAGGVGTILIQLLKAKGYDQIITTAGNANSIEHLQRLGVAPDHILDYKAANLGEEITRLLNGRPLDYAIDLVGGTMAELCASLLSVHGNYVNVTNLVPANAMETLFDKATTMLHVANYTYMLGPHPEGTAIYGKLLDRLFRMIASQVISPAPVNIVGPLSRETVQEAHRLLEGNLSQGKKLVMVNE